MQRQESRTKKETRIERSETEGQQMVKGPVQYEL